MKAKVEDGATGVSTGLKECELTLAVSQKVKAELEARGYQVVMIRESNDVNISSAERAQMANESGASVFVRIHGNSLDNSSVTGVLSMCQTSGNPYKMCIRDRTQLLRALSNTPIQVDITFLMLSSHVSKNTSASHLNKFYITFDEIKKRRFDGMIITGAPVENYEYEDVD